MTTASMVERASQPTDSAQLHRTTELRASDARETMLPLGLADASVVGLPAEQQGSPGP